MNVLELLRSLPTPHVSCCRPSLEGPGTRRGDVTTDSDVERAKRETELTALPPGPRMPGLPGGAQPGGAVPGRCKPVLACRGVFVTPINARSVSLKPLQLLTV